jgi:hypothetical protein
MLHTGDICLDDRFKPAGVPVPPGSLRGALHQGSLDAPATFLISLKQDCAKSSKTLVPPIKSPP